jgi:hypothetical protein
MGGGGGSVSASDRPIKRQSELKDFWILGLTADEENYEYTLIICALHIVSYSN